MHFPKVFRSRTLIGTSAAIVFLLVGCGGSHSSSVEAVTRTISSTTTLSSLTIASNETLVAPDGYSLTLTVDGVEQNIVSGTTYTGTVVLTVTDEHDVTYMGTTHNFRMGLYVEDDAIVAAKSVVSALDGLDYTASYASNGTITSTGDDFNGIVLGGTTGTTTPYTVSNMTLTMNGHGGNDFAGYGAALMSTDTAVAEASNLNISTTGAIRTAVWVGGGSEMTIEGSTIAGHEGTSASLSTFTVPMMKQVPWILGISGNCRATNVLGTAKAHYKNCTVTSEAWGVLSTDSTSTGAELTVEDTTATITGTSGYGSYADGGIQNTYTHTTFNVPDYVLIVAAGACGATFKGNTLGNTVATSKRFGILWHKNQGGTVNIEEGTQFHTGETMFLIKSTSGNLAAPNLVVDNATLKTDSGVLLHLMESDDPGMNASGGGPGSDTMWASSYTVPTPEWYALDTATFDYTSESTNYTANATFKNMNTTNGNALTGDIYNTRWVKGDGTTGNASASDTPYGQNLYVDFQDTEITGVISAGTQSNKYVAAGGEIYPATRTYLGEENVSVNRVYNNGVIVNLEGSSIWTVTGTSYLSKLVLGSGASIVGADGATVTMTIGGVTTPIVAGSTYTGLITLSID
nr:hypothetical protein [uncultured Holophaga sp.]